MVALSDILLSEESPNTRVIFSCSRVVGNAYLG